AASAPAGLVASRPGHLAVQPGGGNGHGTRSPRIGGGPAGAALAVPVGPRLKAARPPVKRDREACGGKQSACWRFSTMGKLFRPEPFIVPLMVLPSFETVPVSWTGA